MTVTPLVKSRRFGRSAMQIPISSGR
jgi:hypothetical protein